MNRLERKWAEVRKSRRNALSVFLTAGYPTIEATERVVLALEQSGVDFFEIGFPFSDPIADGPVIQKSSEYALKHHMSWKKVLDLARRIRKKSQVPLIFMSYANPLFHKGWAHSARQLADAGFDGAIVPDLIPEECSKVKPHFKENGLCLVHLLAPTSSPERIKLVGRASSGFIYCVSVTGVTGARKALPLRDIGSFLKRVKRSTRLPVVLGFGISDPRQCRAFQNAADGFVIGSAMIRALEGARSANEAARRARRLINPFVKAVQ